MHVDYVQVQAEPAALDNDILCGICDDILCGICDIRDWKLLLLDYMLLSAGLWFEEKGGMCIEQYHGCGHCVNALIE